MNGAHVGLTLGPRPHLGAAEFLKRANELRARNANERPLRTLTKKGGRQDEDEDEEEEEEKKKTSSGVGRSGALH